MEMKHGIHRCLWKLEATWTRIQCDVGYLIGTDDVECYWLIIQEALFRLVADELGVEVFKTNTLFDSSGFLAECCRQREAVRDKE